MKTKNGANMVLNKRVAVVTGGGSGIGLAVGLRLAEDGARIAICDWDADAAAGAAQKIQEATGAMTMGLSVDVSNELQVADGFARVVDEWGSLDILVNNAGITSPAMIGSITAEDWQRIYRVNVDGSFYCIKAAAEYMKLRNFGRIINTASGAALMGDIGQLHYSSSKGAVVSMTRSAARELARYQITVNAISPVAVTPMTQPALEHEKLAEQYRRQIPLGRVAEPEEIAAAYAFLASPGASYVTGVILRVDGGRAIGT